MSHPLETTSDAARAQGVSSTRKLVLGIVLAAFALRLLYMVVTGTYLFPDELINQRRVKFQIGFETGRVARSIATGHGFSSPFEGNTGPTAWLTPVYPYLVAAVFRVLGVYTTASSVVILIFNGLCAALTCIPIFLIGRKLASRRVGLWAAVLWAVLPSFMAIPMTWVWETSLTALLLTLLVLLTLKLAETDHWKPWFGMGLLWGLAALTNPAVLSFLPVSLLWAGWQNRRQGRKFIAPMAVAALVFVLAITPWLVRNYRAFGQFVFLRGNFGAELRYGNVVYGRGVWACCSHPSLNDAEFQKYAQLGELRYIQTKRQEALDFIRQYPGIFVGLTIRRIVYFWNGIPDVWSEDLEPFDMLKNWPYLFLSAVGLLGAAEMLRQKQRGAGLLIGLLLIYPAPYYITYPHERYRHLIEPVLLLLAVYVFAQTRELHRRFYPGRASD